MSVQTKLTDDGYYHGQIDGVLGSSSLEAIRQFQSDHGLSANGKIDPKLLDALGIQSNQQNQQQNARIVPALIGARRCSVSAYAISPRRCTSAHRFVPVKTAKGYPLRAIPLSTAAEPSLVGAAGRRSSR